MEMSGHWSVLFHISSIVHEWDLFYYDIIKCIMLLNLKSHTCSMESMVAWMQLERVCMVNS